MDHETEELLARLERLAEDLDTQQFPGEAWPAADRPSPRHRHWKAIGVIVAVAAALALLFQLFGARPSRQERGPTPQDVVVDPPAPAEDTTLEEVVVPTILVVEDFDSYSFIDLSSDVPLVSFVKKDTFMPECVVPLLPDADVQSPVEGDVY